MLNAEQMRERLKDPKTFIEHFFWITNKQKETVPFILNLPQNTYYKNRTNFDLILKARKEGFSSLVEAMGLHRCMFSQNERVVTMAQNEDEMKVHRDRIDGFLKTLGSHDIKFRVTIDNENQKEFEFTDSKSKFWLGTAGSTTFGRSRDITILHCTEVAHYKDQSVLTGVLNACIDSAWRVFETTANGMERFYQLWVEAIDKASGSVWTPHFFSWFDDTTNALEVSETYRIPPRWLGLARKYPKLKKGQIAWYDKKYAEQTDKSLLFQEFPSDWHDAFVSSGRHVFNLEMLDDMSRRCTYPKWVGEISDDGHTIAWIDNPEGYWSVWKHPRAGKRYLITADISEGVAGGSWSVMTVFDRSSWEVVAEWRGRIDPAKFGDLMETAGFYFGNAILIPENNNLGHVTIQRLVDNHYPHILKTTDLWPEGTRDQYGFPTNDKTKSHCISALRNAINDRTYWENSKGAIEEMRTAVYDDRGKIVSSLQIAGDDRNQDKGFLDRMITRGIGLYSLKFLSLDDSYREDKTPAKSFYVTSNRVQSDNSSRVYRSYVE